MTPCDLADWIPCDSTIGDDLYGVHTWCASPDYSTESDLGFPPDPHRADRRHKSGDGSAAELTYRCVNGLGKQHAEAIINLECLLP